MDNALSIGRVGRVNVSRLISIVFLQAVGGSEKV